MIQTRTILKLADNSGALKLMCIGFVGIGNRRNAQIGDIIVCSVKEAEPGKQIKKGQVVKAVIVRQKKPYLRKNGTWIKFDENAAVIIDNRNEPVGNRIFGPIPREIKEKGFNKIANLAPQLV
ncbi:MAG: 50S ribosomal protein L14 [Candidatus Parcubacteria bacterium]|nr:MAG: 50S ribosomal protein L14 [Candidatus Parcubacteria bacterium]